MRILITAATLVLMVCGAASFADDLVTTQLVDKAVGLEATVVIINPENNSGFCFIDVPKRVEGDTMLRHWQSNYELMINGGYYEADFSPTGKCRINGKNIHRKRADKLSGYVVVDKAGRLDLLHREDDVSAYPNVIQAGPYLIDPGGGMGIRANNGSAARRTLIGKTTDGRLLIMVTKPITLFELAGAIKAHFPDIERLLNLDGGPSTGMKTHGIEIPNQWPVRNYLVKRGDPGIALPTSIETLPKPKK